MATRSYLRQLAQIKHSDTFDDTLYMPGCETSGTANLQDDLNFVRTQLRIILGETNWFDAPDRDISTLYTDTTTASGRIDANTADIANASGMIDNIQNAMGMVDGDTTLTYTSTNYIGVNDTVEVAVSTLDAQASTNASGIAANLATILIHTDELSNIQTFCGAASGDTSPTYSSTTWAAGDLEAAIGALDAALTITSGLVGPGICLDSRVTDVLTYEWPTASGEKTLPGSKLYTIDNYNGKYLQCYVNGQLQLVGSGATNEYAETSTSGVSFNYNLVADDVLTYVIFS